RRPNLTALPEERAGPAPHLAVIPGVETAILLEASCNGTGVVGLRTAPASARVADCVGRRKSRLQGLANALGRERIPCHRRVTDGEPVLSGYLVHAIAVSRNNAQCRPRRNARQPM